MKYFTLLLIILCLQSVSAQNDILDIHFAIVKDKDGWVNVRDNLKNIKDNLKNNELVYVYENIADATWLDIDYTKDGATENGLIHRSRLFDVKNLTRIPCSKKDSLQYTFKDNLYEIKINIVRFNSTNRTLEYDKEGNWLKTIDNKFPWGAEISVPKYQYNSIEIRKNGKIISLPKEALDNLFEPNLDSVEVFHDPESNNLYVISLNSDGAGGYIAAWTIENDNYKERLITHGF